MVLVGVYNIGIISDRSGNLPGDAHLGMELQTLTPKTKYAYLGCSAVQGAESRKTSLCLPYAFVALRIYRSHKPSPTGLQTPLVDGRIVLAQGVEKWCDGMQRGWGVWVITN